MTDEQSRAAQNMGWQPANEAEQPVAPAESARPKLSRGTKIGLLVFLLAVVGVAVWGFWPKAPLTLGPLTVATDGEYTVGSGAGQLTPGTWRTPTPAKGVDPLSCRWTLTLPGGTQMDQGTGMPDRVVTLAEGETFETQDCGNWVLSS